MFFYNSRNSPPEPHLLDLQGEMIEIKHINVRNLTPPDCFVPNFVNMTALTKYIPCILLLAMFLGSCTQVSTATEEREDCPEIIGPWPEYGKDGLPGIIRLTTGETLDMSVLYVPAKTAKAVWKINGEEKGQGSDFSFTPESEGEFLLRLEVSNRSGIVWKEARIIVTTPMASGPFPIEKGVNIGNWLSQSSTRGGDRDKAFTEKDVKALASYGFDHIRLPVDEEQLFDTAGNLDKEVLALVHRTIRYCRDAGMRVLFDLHIIRSHHFNDDVNPLWEVPAEQEKLLEMWRAIDSELKVYPADLVAYEFLNEPVADDPASWNSLYNRLIAQIRETDKDRVLVIEANRWGGVRHIKEMDIPLDDTNLILQFHFYEPFLMTSYQASWGKFADLNFSTPMKYPGKLISDAQYQALTDSEKALVQPYYKYYDKNTFADMWKDAIRFAKDKGLRLYLGEFGCLSNCGKDNRNNWVSDIVDLCRGNGIPYSWWEYNHSYGFADRSGNVIHPDLLEILTCQ